MQGSWVGSLVTKVLWVATKIQHSQTKYLKSKMKLTEEMVTLL